MVDMPGISGAPKLTNLTNPQADRQDEVVALSAWVQEISDDELLRRMGQRDEAALATLYDRYGGLVFTVSLRIVGDRELAQEVMQDAFLRCWDASASFDPNRGPAGGWLLRIARNRAIDLLRSRQHQARLRESTSLPEPGEPGAIGEADATEAIVTRHAVTAALAALPPPQRRVVELAFYGGLSQTEIAALLGEPLGTVKSRTRAAMERLRTTLRPHFRLGPDASDDGEMHA
jgi:RNA polymerase sigma-70 factor (ECF subfamily)